MNKYEITFVSRDGQSFTYLTSQLTKQDAIKATQEKIRRNGWIHYMYQFEKGRLL